MSLIRERMVPWSDGDSVNITTHKSQVRNDALFQNKSWLQTWLPDYGRYLKVLEPFTQGIQLTPHCLPELPVPVSGGISTGHSYRFWAVADIDMTPHGSCN